MSISPSRGLRCPGPPPRALRAIPPILAIHNPARPPRPPADRSYARLGVGLVTLALAIAALLFSVVIVDHCQRNAVEARRFADSLGFPGARSDRLVGRIDIRSVGIRAFVEDTLGRDVPRQSVVRLPGSADAGRQGRLVLAGSRDTHFRALDDIAIDDRIELATADGVHVYTVYEVTVVGPGPLDSIAPVGGPTLTLIALRSSDPSEGTEPPELQIVVRARLTGSTPAA